MIISHFSLEDTVLAKTQQNVIIYKNTAISTAQSQFEEELPTRQKEGWRLVSVTPINAETGNTVQLTVIYERENAPDNDASLPFNQTDTIKPAEETRDVALADDIPPIPDPEVPAQLTPDNPYPFNPYQQALSSSRTDALPYSKILLLSFSAAFVLAFVFMGLPQLGISLFGGILISMFIIDWKGLLTVDGLLKWRQMSNNKRVGMGCLLYCFFPVFVIIYLFRMGSKVFRGPGPVFSTEWNAPVSVKKRANVSMIIGSISAIILLIGSVSATPANSNTTVGNSPNQTPVVAATQTPTQQPSPTATPTPTATPSPTPVPTWTVTQTFSGNGNKKTSDFVVPDHWRLVWSCNPSSFYGGSYNVIVDVDNVDGSYLDPAAINTICQSGNTGDFTEEYQGGDVYLDVNSEGSWTLQVEALK